MKIKSAFFGTLIFLMAANASSWAQDLRSEMEAANAEWLAAYNAQQGPSLATMYSNDATLLPPDSPPISGAAAIGKYWSDDIKSGNFKNHTWKILSIQQAGKDVVQLATFTIDFVKDGQTTHYQGNTVRVLEKGANGKWLTKVHIYNSR